MSPREPHTARVAGRVLGGERLFVIAGPCVLERLELAVEIAEHVAEICADLGIDYVFKASFDKANRTAATSERGPGLSRGLAWLAHVRERVGVPVLTDVHLPEQCPPVAEICDILQIPAFLCRQTDLLQAAAATNRAVNIKKGQFLAPWDMRGAVEKCRAAGGENILVTERGSCFGYGRLVVDMAGLHHLRETDCPVVFDATHSVQEPGALGGRTGGDRRRAPALARAALATGDVDGLFCEVHPDPDSSPSDGPNMIRLAEFREMLEGCLRCFRP